MSVHGDTAMSVAFEKPPAQADPVPERAGHVLIVDRMPLGRLISKMLTGRYTTDVVGDAMSAIDRLQGVSPDIIVADIDVPGNGLRMAELVGISPKYSSIPVILMSAKPTSDLVLRARSAGASSYLAKPFGPSHLQARIDFLLSHASGGAAEETDAAIEKRVRTIEGLPPFPATYAEIMSLARSPEADSEDISEKIQLDPGLLATVLKLANSSYFGFRERIDSPRLAVTLLGLKEVANLVVSAQVFAGLGRYEHGAGMDLKAFWRHSVGTAFVARAIAKRVQVEAESAFLAGMLHDLGKIVLDRYFPDFYAPVIGLVRAEKMQTIRAEQEALGVTHTDVGGQLAIEWKLPEKFQDCILYHHHPQVDCRYQRLVCLVHLADAFCSRLGYGSGDGGGVPEIDRSARLRFSLGSRSLEILFEAAQEELQGADSFLSALGN